ncbi:hypothetical protein [Candidatus Rhabdochlamydia porcellionis]|jgi:hypothetical protein|uniref:Uncharacterized protein n=1 Tax=Candidatus Rhabdochlamydia porcellionis TaxID=225148 RepID=A0ABX8Z283_9BACT|nr:hypothetical protein [Candidatus Rhabdochlamydia porcellionis]QZA58222.1 hypothetical protein RHAB15C_0000092 [Candidatus Rhabdochlamydia porcellionis]
MSLPIGSAAIVTRDEATSRALQEQAHQAAHRQSTPAKATLKTQAEACIEKYPSLNDQSKDISKQTASSSIDTCVDLTTQEAVKAVFRYLKPSSS